MNEEPPNLRPAEARRESPPKLSHEGCDFWQTIIRGGSLAMKRKRHSVSEIMAAVKQHEMELPTATLTISYSSIFSGHNELARPEVASTASVFTTCAMPTAAIASAIPSYCLAPPLTDDHEHQTGKLDVFVKRGHFHEASPLFRADRSACSSDERGRARRGAPAI